MTIKNRLDRLEKQKPQTRLTWRELMELETDLPGWAEFMGDPEEVRNDNQKQDSKT